MRNEEMTYFENDKIQAPYLLAASFNGLISFEGKQYQNGVLYWLFSPKDRAKELVEQLHRKNEPQIPLIDLFQAIEMFWKQVAELRNGGIYGGN